MAADYIVETQDLSIDFNGFYAVEGVSLKVARGSIHALIGPNGAGKTTCFHLITKFLRPTGGKILYKGAEDITRARPADVARLGMVRSFQISAPPSSSGIVVVVMLFRRSIVGEIAARLKRG